MVHTALVSLASSGEGYGQCGLNWSCVKSDSLTYGVVSDRRWHPGEKQFSSRWYLYDRKSPYALYPASRKFPQCCP